jgi:hypothetical protein
MARHKHADVAWMLPAATSYDVAQLAVLMDIRDELQALRRLAQCHRIPRALDAMTELGIEARRRKRAAAKRRKTARARK